MMTAVTHLFLFIGSFALIWLAAGFLLGAIDRVSRYFQKSGFIVAFLVLGLLTSLTEISVALNSSWQEVPSVSAGNLASASFVIFFLVIPIFAIVGNGIHLKGSINKKDLLLSLVVISLAPIVAMIGTMHRFYGFILIAAYAVLVYSISRDASLAEHRHAIKKHLKKATLVRALFSLAIAACIIFVASRFLVKEAVYFSEVLAIPSSLMGILILSLGTNLPELTIAIRAVLKHRKAIAFGDYIGSASLNTLILGFLIVFNGPFVVHQQEFIITAILMVLGMILFWFFATSKYTISRLEGSILLLVYIAFFVIELLAFAV